jgi:hypothetical protein
LNVVHAATVIIGLVLLAMVTAPLGLLIKEALENPTLLNANIWEESNKIVVQLTYNGSIELTDVNFTTTLVSHNNIISKSATADVLNRNSTLTIIFPKNETGGGSEVTIRELLLAGKVSGIYPFRITYKLGQG